MSSVQIGNAGEHFVMSCLLARGIHAGLADRGNPQFDILARNTSGVFHAIRVKATRVATFQWTAKETWDPLPGVNKDTPDPFDISILVAFNESRPSLNTEVFVMPTARVVEDLNRVNRHYHNHRNRDGSVRKLSKQRVIRLGGKKKHDNIAYAFRNDWSEFQDAWEVLD